MPQINEQTFLKKEPYRSILNLLRHCSYLNHERIGLQHGHFLYALKTKKLKMNIETEKEMKQFFNQFHFKSKAENGFESLYGGTKNLHGVEIKLSGELKRECIKHPQRLNDALVLLIKKKWVETEGKPRYRRYYLSRKYWTDLEKRSITSLLNIWDENTFVTSESLYRYYLDNPDGFNPLKPGDVFYPLQTNSNFVLCGLPTKLIKDLSDEEKKNLNNWLLTIEIHLWNILELKYLKTKKSLKGYIEKELQDKKPVEDLIQSNHIGFYYTARKSIVEE
jgi:hypothetical protein